MKNTLVAALAGILALQPLLTTSAAAGEGWRRGHGPYGYHRPYRAEPNYGRHVYPAPRRDRSGDAVGAAVLGIGALIIGAAIADAARRERRERRYYD